MTLTIPMWLLWSLGIGVGSLALMALGAFLFVWWLSDSFSPFR